MIWDLGERKTLTELAAYQEANSVSCVDRSFRKLFAMYSECFLRNLSPVSWIFARFANLTPQTRTWGANFNFTRSIRKEGENSYRI